jgi:hypothetical protein
MGHTNRKHFRYNEVIFVVMVMFVGVSYGLANSKRHPYAFIKPLSRQDGVQGPSPYSYSDSEATGVSLINSNTRPALSTSDFDRLVYHEDKQRSLSADSSSPFSSNTLFENVPLPPIRDEEKNNEDKAQSEDMGDLNDRLSTSRNVAESTLTRNLYNARNAIHMKPDMEDPDEKNKVNMPIIGDITKDNKRRVVIPLRYRNKRRKNNEDDTDLKDNKEKEDKKNNNFESLVAQETRYSVSSVPSIQISISDLDEPSTTTTRRPTVVTSSSKIENKVPAFVLNLKNKFETDSETDHVVTKINNKKPNKKIKHPIAFVLHADDLKSWGVNRLNQEDDKSPSSTERSVDQVNESHRPKFSDTNVLFADGDIYSRLQKHKQVFTSRNVPESKSSSYHNLQSRELPRTSHLQDMTPSGCSFSISTQTQSCV